MKKKQELSSFDSFLKEQSITITNKDIIDKLNNSSGFDYIKLEDFKKFLDYLNNISTLTLSEIKLNILEDGEIINSFNNNPLTHIDIFNYPKINIKENNV